MLDELTRDTFARQLGTQFRVEIPHGGTVTLELVEASDARSAPDTESFPIVFRGPSGAFLPEAIHRFKHDELSAFELFIVPLRQDAQGFYYEAVFTRLRREGQA